MPSSKNSALPRNRLLRQTVAGLLFAIPTLSLTGCGGDDGGCWWYKTTSDAKYNLPLAGGGMPTSDTCMGLCVQRKPETQSCEVKAAPSDGGTPDGGQGATAVLHCYYTAHICGSDGRQPEGLQSPRMEARCALGTLFARMAWLEAASVPAFLRLADELAEHGAPPELIRAARRSAGEEVRHARAMGALAQRHGAPVPAVEVAPFSPRSLEAMALENATEGCVRETFGAVLAGWRARTAQDAQVREELGRIAEDELRHAELAWAVDAWAAERLTPTELQRVRDARREAFEELERQVALEEPEAVLIEQAGMPSRDSALQLARGLRVLIA